MKFENCDIHDNTIIENAQITAAGTIIDVKTGMKVGEAKPVDVEEVVTEEAFTDNLWTICDNSRSQENNIDFPKIFVDAPSQAFTNPNELVKACLKEAMDAAYTGQPTQLAYLLICCFAYRLTNNLSCYKAFVRTLMLWGLLPYDAEAVDQTANTLGIKVRNLKNPNFRSWGDDLINERSICEEMSRAFEAHHCYYRYTEC